MGIGKKEFLNEYAGQTSLPNDMLSSLWDRIDKGLDSSLSQDARRDAISEEIKNSLSDLNAATDNIAKAERDSKQSLGRMDRKEAADWRKSWFDSLKKASSDYNSAFNALFDPDSSTYLNMGSNFKLEAKTPEGVTKLGSMLISETMGKVDKLYGDDSSGYKKFVESGTGEFDMNKNILRSSSIGSSQEMIDLLNSGEFSDTYSEEEIGFLVNSYENDIKSNSSLSQVGSNTNYRDLLGQTPEEQREAQQALKVGSTSTGFVGADNSQQEAQRIGQEQEALLGAKGVGVTQDYSQQNDRRTAYQKLVNEGVTPTEEQIQRELTGHTGASGTQQSSSESNSRRTNYQNLVNEGVSPDDITEADLSAVAPVDDVVTTPDDVVVTPEQEASNDGELSGTSFSGTTATDSKYRQLLEGQLATGLSDNLAGRASNAILSGERMGAEGLTRLAADTRGAASQGVAQSGNLGQGAAINAEGSINRQNTQAFGDMAAKNTAIRAQEQSGAKDKTQKFLEFSEGARRSKATEDNMKLGSMLEWYKELKGTHAGQAETLMEGMREITGTQLNAEQAAFQKDQANLSAEQNISSLTAQNFVDDGDLSSLATSFKRDPLTGLYNYDDGSGVLRSVDAETSAMINSQLSFGSFSGFQYDDSGRVIPNGSFNQGEFNKSLKDSFATRNFDDLNKLRAYVPDYGTGDSTAWDMSDSTSGVTAGDVIEYNGDFTRVMEVQPGRVRLQGEDGIVFTIGG